MDITYDDALKHFREQGPFWDALVAGINDLREGKIADLKRNASTPNCNELADAKAIAGLLAFDDILFEFKKVDKKATE